MLREAVEVIEFISPQLSFISSILIFLGGGYIALHSRIMPKWLVTCLWYLGLFALLNVFTLIIEWVWGQHHPLSHFQLGTVTETLIITVLAVTVGLLFFHTVW